MMTAEQMYGAAVVTGATKVKTHRLAAAIVGVFYIVAAVAAVLGLYFYGPILNGADYLAHGAANANQVTLGAVMELLLVFSAIGTAVGLFPFVRRYNESIALGYLYCRFLEAVLITVGIVSVLSLLTLSQAYVAAASPDASAFNAAGTLLLAVHRWTFLLGPALMLGVNTTLYSYLFFRSRLIPRLLAALGLIGGVLVFLQAVLTMFGVVSQVSAPGALLAVPVALYEMTLAVWLIVKGFNQSALASRSAR